ncbi:MAG: VapC toxin family PIN domain ribonuclease [Verrucomicrobiota bacterium]
MLLAIAWPQHVHHARVKRWLLAQTARGKLSIATCPLTQLGFLRISMNIKGYAADFESARSLLSSLVNHKDFEHSFWMDDFSILSGSLKRNPGPNQLTDAYLATLAENRDNSRLVTLDTGIKGSSVEVIAN